MSCPVRRKSYDGGRRRVCILRGSKYESGPRDRGGNTAVTEFPNTNFGTIRALDTKPLSRPHTITVYEQIGWPRLGMVDFGGFGGIRREFAAWVEEALPKIPVSIASKDHRQTARSMLPLEAD